MKNSPFDRFDKSRARERERRVNHSAGLIPRTRSASQQERVPLLPPRLFAHPFFVVVNCSFPNWEFNGAASARGRPHREFFDLIPLSFRFALFPSFSLFRRLRPHLLPFCLGERKVFRVIDDPPLPLFSFCRRNAPRAVSIPRNRVGSLFEISVVSTFLEKHGGGRIREKLREYWRMVWWRNG